MVKFRKPKKEEKRRKTKRRTWGGKEAANMEGQGKSVAAAEVRRGKERGKGQGERVSKGRS